MRIIRAALLASIASIGTTAAHAASSDTPVRTWSTPGDLISVQQFAGTKGESDVCVLTADTTDHSARFSLAKDGTGVVLVGFVASGQTRNTKATVTYEVAGRTYAVTSAPVGNGWLMGSAPAGEMLHGLYNAQVLAVQPDGQPAPSIFPLTGSATAIALLDRCRDSVTAPAPIGATRGDSVTRIPLQRDDTGFFVSASIDGDPALSFALDSGAGFVAIPRWVADKLAAEGKLTEADFVQHGGTMTMADGTHSHVDYVKLHSVVIGNRIVHDALAMVTDQGTPLLGMSVLGRFQSWTVENSTGTLILSGDAAQAGSNAGG